MAERNIVTLPVEQIIIDKDRMQAREKINQTVVSEYADLYREGTELPPITVFKVGDDYFLVDGFHRFAAQKKLDFTEVPVELREGDMADALRYAAGANATHGQRRTPGDARRAALIAIAAIRLGNPKKRPTVNQIKELAGVGTSTVQAAFDLLKAAGQDVGEKDPRGRKKKVDTSTSVEYDTPEGEKAEGEGEGDEDLTPALMMMRQAELTKNEVEDAIRSARTRIDNLDRAEVAGNGSELRMAWLVIAGMLDGFAGEIRAALGTPNGAGDPDFDFTENGSTDSPSGESEPTPEGEPMAEEAVA